MTKKTAIIILFNVIVTLLHFSKVLFACTTELTPTDVRFEQLVRSNLTSHLHIDDWRALPENGLAQFSAVHVVQK